jgi:protein involved in temperature-dependent protein secretion
MAKATNSLPLNPELTFKHISVDCIHVLARLIAKKEVQAQLRAQGVRVQYVRPAEINERATAYLSQHPEVWKEALARAHQIDDAEGQRKARQRLRRQELRQRRSVYESDHAKTPIEKTQEKLQPAGD